MIKIIRINEKSLKRFRIPLFIYLGNKEFFDEFWLLAGKHLVEDVVVTFASQLEGDTRFFEQVSLDITTREAARGTEVDTDEFTESGRVIVTKSFGIT